MDKVRKTWEFEGAKSETLWTGQAIKFFKTPQEIVDRMNVIYDEGMKEGKFRKRNQDADTVTYEQENEIYRSDNNPNIENFNYIPDDIHEWIKNRIHQYLQELGVQYIGIQTAVAWINDLSAGEYIPTHSHISHGSSGLFPLRGDNPYDAYFTWPSGLVGMMTLKLPEEELTDSNLTKFDRHGELEFISTSGKFLFGMNYVSLKLKVGDFIVFPGDMLHHVYPHFNSTKRRRTFPTNIDVFCDEFHQS